MAGRIARDAKLRMNVNQSSWEEHRPDVVQEVLIKLYECEARGMPPAYAEVAAQRVATVYIVRHIYKQTYSSTYDPNDPLEDEYRYEHHTLKYGQIDLSKKAKYRVTRPVENVVAHDETAGERFWQKVERTFLEVLAGMRKTIHYEGMARMARMLCLSCQGYSPAAIAVELDLEPTQVWAALVKARKSVERFLAKAVLLQGAIRARGYFKTLHPEDLTPEILHSRCSYQVVMPCGHFQIRVEPNRKSPRMLKRVNCNGKSKLLQHTFTAKAGGLGLEQVYAASYAIQEKAEAFYATHQVSERR